MELDLIIGGFVGIAIAYFLKVLKGRQSNTLDEVKGHSERSRDRATKAAERDHAESVANIDDTRRKIQRAKLAELSDMINEELPDE